MHLNRCRTWHEEQHATCLAATQVWSVGCRMGPQGEKPLDAPKPTFDADNSSEKTFDALKLTFCTDNSCACARLGKITRAADKQLCLSGSPLSSRGGTTPSRMLNVHMHCKLQAWQ